VAAVCRRLQVCPEVTLLDGVRITPAQPALTVLAETIRRIVGTRTRPVFYLLRHVTVLRHERLMHLGVVDSRSASLELQTGVVQRCVACDADAS
jgi:hypothetical protein